MRIRLLIILRTYYTDDGKYQMVTIELVDSSSLFEVSNYSITIRIVNRQYFKNG